MSDGRIVIETHLDTSGFEKDVDKAVKKAAKDLSDGMDKATKKSNDSTKNTSTIDGSKVAKQFDIVSKSIDNTSKKIENEQHKLATLQQAYSKATNPTQKNKIDEQITNTQGKIIGLQSKLDGLKDKQVNLKFKMDEAGISQIDRDLEKVGEQANVTAAEVNKALSKPIDSNSIKEMGNNIQSAGEKVSSLGSTLNTHVTLPIVAAAAASGKFAADFEHQMADISKEVKAKGEDVNIVMAQMSSSSIKWSEDYGQSTDDINKGLLILVKDGYSGAESMNIMNTALKTARGANEDLFTTIDKLGGSLEAYQMKSDNAATTTANMSHMADTFAYISNHTKASIDSLGEAFSTVGQTASALEQPMEQTAAAIGILESSNINASTAATSLKAGLVNLTKPTKNMQKGMKELGIEAFDSNGKMKDYATIVDDINKGSKNLTTQQKESAIAMTFGKESLASWTTLINKGGDYLRNLATNAGNATGEVQELSDSMANTPVNKMKEAEASFKALAITFGEDVLPELMPLVQELTNTLKSFSELDEETKKQIVDFALMAAAVGPVLKIVGGLTNGIGSLVKFGGKLATTFGLLGEGTAVSSTALTGFSIASVAAVGASTSLVAGVAGIITYNQLLGKSVNTSTDDLNTWEKVVNDLTGSTIKSKDELQKAGLVYKDFGNGVSKEFKNGIEEATKSYHDFEIELTKDNMGDKISVDDQGKLTASINKMIDGAKSAINSRKGEIQNQLTDLFTADGSGIDENEQKVLDISTQGADEKLAKIAEIQGKISDVWTKAIEQHGKLSEEDIATIKNYLVQVQQIKAEVEAKNDAESSFSKNDFSERLNGISASDASKEYTDASNTVKENFVKLKATYKTGIDELNDMQKKSKDDFNNAQTDEDKKKAQDDITAIQKQIDDKTKAYEEATGKEQSQIREYLNMLYKKNPSLENNMNEIDGTLFSTTDKDAQARKEKIRSQFSELADTTKTGIQQVQDANGKWHDIYVTFDEATGNITGTYDTFTGKYGGYSAKFEKDIKATGEKIKAEMEDLQKSLSLNGGGVKLDGDNNAINATTDQLITKLDTVVQKADGAKTAIQDINGTKVRLEFDKDGALTNAQDIEDAINGKLADNPAVVKTKIEVDGSQVSTIDDTIKKLQELPPETKTNITINGEEAETTADEAIKKLQEIPPDTDTDIVINSADADGKLDTTKEKVEEVDAEQPNVDATANTSNADDNLDTTKSKIDNLNGQEADTTVKVDTGDSLSLLDRIKNFFEWLTGRTVTAKVNVDESGDTQTNYTGTNVLKTGLSKVNEHGYESANNSNVKMLDGGLAYLIGNHYSGGDGINDHMTTVNEMHDDISKQVGSTFGQAISKLLSGFGIQENLLKGIVTNTQNIVTNGDKANQLSKQTAESMINNWNSQSGTFANLQTEITNANSAKDKASKMKVEDNYWYSSTKAQYDDLEKQIKDIGNENSKLQSQKQESFDKSTSKDVSNANKSIELQVKENDARKAALEDQKNDLQSSVDYYKDAAQKEIDTCKEQAEQEVKIATDKKDKLTKLAEAVTTAIKNQLTQQKDAYDTTSSAELTKLEDEYNKKVTDLENNATAKSEELDRKIKALEKESTDTSRADERSEANNNISALQTKIANSADEADKRKFQLELAKAQSELNKKEDSWNIEDQKTELEDEKTKISKDEETKKKTLETEYNASKAAKEKEIKATDAYYDKLLETDSINAKARYTLLNSNSQDLVNLLNSYNVGWQNAGKNLADSLLDGLESQKQTVQQSVDDMISLRGANTNSAGSPSAYYDESGHLLSGYASGTNSNPLEGYYYTNEDGSEMSTNGDVAYVSQGASIKNRMQTDKFISSEIAGQVALMKSAVIQSQMDIARSLGSLISRTTTNNNNVSKVYQPILQIKEYHQHTNQDAEQLANEFGVIAYKQKVD